MRDPYAVLGVKRTASMDEIKAAWRTLAKSMHPDHNMNDPQANARFAEVGEAYRLLKDPEKRYRYDIEQRGFATKNRRKTNPGDGHKARAGNEGFASFFANAGEARRGQNNNGGDDILSQMWRKISGKQPAPEKAPDLQTELEVTIEDIMKQERPLLTLPEGKTLRITLPEGVTDGKQIRIPAQGHKLPGFKRGDVIVTFRIAQHSIFQPEGLNLHTIVPVDIENAVLGCETIVDTPDGPVKITVPEWSGSDRVVRIKGRGLPGKDGTRGDVMAEIRVMLWDHPDEKVKDLMRSLREGLFL